MNTSKHLQSLTKKYYTLSPRIFLSRNIYKKHFIKPTSHLTPLCHLSAESCGSFCFPHPSVPTYKNYSSEPSAAQKCSVVFPDKWPIKFEELHFEPPVVHEELMEVLQKCTSLSDQMEKLAGIMALTPQDIENRKKFCKTLELLFKPFFNNVKIEMFGSSVNHFGFKGCDIDMTFETSSDPSEQPVQKVPFLERPDVPLISEVINGKATPDDISSLPSKEQLIFMHTVLLEYYKESSEPPIFINAHVPLVRFHHDKFNLKCDLTIKNKVAFANTKLLSFYAKLDKRVIPLVMTLRYWAKHIELIGKGLMFNTYTVSLMIIHFLQTRNPPVLPSAESILTLSDNFETEDMDDRRFLNLIESLPPSKNYQPIDELLKEFFFYYLYFDYSRVISPLTGSSIPRKEYFSVKHPKFVLNTISVEDPLCLSHNVAELVEFKVAKKLYAECVSTCKLLQENPFSGPSPDSWGLMAVLDKPDNYITLNLDLFETVSFMLPYSVNKSIDDGLSLKSRGSVTAKLLLKLARHVLFFNCSHLEEDKIKMLLEEQDKMTELQLRQLERSSKNTDSNPNPRKKSKLKSYLMHEISKLSSTESVVEQFVKVNEKNELILCCKCKISKNVWTGRDLVKLNPSNLPTDIMNREHAISKEVIRVNEENNRDTKKKIYNYLLECYIASNAPEPSILVNFRPLQRDEFNSTLSIFLKDYIPKIMSNPGI